MMRDAGYTATEMKTGTPPASGRAPPRIRSYIWALSESGPYLMLSPRSLRRLSPQPRAPAPERLVTYHPSHSSTAAAGYDCTRLRDAGYSAAEANEAHYTVKDMFVAGYEPRGLRDCGYGAPVLREAGYELLPLKGAGFVAEELMEAGWTAKEIKEVRAGMPARGAHRRRSSWRMAAA